MDTRKQGNTSEMQVTSIRLEPELKERLRDISGAQGYQTLIRDVLWQFVEQQTLSDRVRSLPYENRRFSFGEATPTTSHPSLLSMSNIRATFKAVAQQEERCAITGHLIHPQQMMWLGLMTTGEIVPLSIEMSGYENGAIAINWRNH